MAGIVDFLKGEYEAADIDYRFGNEVGGIIDRLKALETE